MTTRKYQLTVAFKPGLSPEEFKKGQKALTEAVESRGGKVEKNGSLGVKPLAYSIAGATQASFERLILTIPADEASSLRQDLEKSNRFIRVFLDREER